MAEENSKSPHSQAQQIPLSKIHDLPGVFVGKQPDKSYGGLVTSIQAGGVKEPVVLRLREDGEYQLVTGYRRRRASGGDDSVAICPEVVLHLHGLIYDDGISLLEIGRAHV